MWAGFFSIASNKIVPIMTFEDAVLTPMLMAQLERCAVRTSSGTVLEGATFEKLKKDLEYLIFLHRTGYVTNARMEEGMESTIDLYQFITINPDGTVNADGAVDKLERLVKKFVIEIRATEKKRRELAENRLNILHDIFTTEGSNKLPYANVITMYLGKSGVRMAELEAEEKLITEAIQKSDQFGRVLGPQGGLVRVRTANGDLVRGVKQVSGKLFLDDTPITFGIITRKKKGDAPLAAADSSPSYLESDNQQEEEEETSEEEEEEHLIPATVIQQSVANAGKTKRR